MTSIVLNNVNNLQSTTTAQNTINSNNTSIVAAVNASLAKDGSDSKMSGVLDLNSNQVINLPNPATADSPLRLQDLNSFVGGGTVTNIPSGGTAGQVLIKNSNNNFDVGWSSNPDVVGPSSSSVGNVVSWNNTTGTQIADSGLAVTNIVTPSSTNVFTNKTLDTAGAGNVLKINGTQVSAVTGTGSVVLATSPSLTTPNLDTPSSLTLTNATGLPISTGVSGLGTGVATLLGGASSGTGGPAGTTSPSFTTPVLGTPTSGTLTNCAGLPVSTGISGLGTGVATLLSGASTGTGGPVGKTSPALTTPALGTPTSGTLTSCTGLPISTGVSGLGTGVATLLGGNSSGTGGPAGTTSPTFTTPVLGTPTSGTLTNCTGLPISSGVSGLGTGVATAAGNNTNANSGLITQSAAVSWTPVVTTDGTTGTPAYTTQIGHAIQVGNLVIAWFQITLSGWTGSPTGNLIINGLPVACSASEVGNVNLSFWTVSALLTGVTFIGGQVSAGSTGIVLYQGGNSTSNRITAAQSGTTPTFQGVAIYRT